MIGFTFGEPNKLIGRGAAAIQKSIASMSSGTRGGSSYAIRMAQNWHSIPMAGKTTGTAIWADIEVGWNEFANNVAGTFQRLSNTEMVMKKVCVFFESRIKERIRATLRNTPRGSISRGEGGVASTGRLSSDWSHVVSFEEDGKVTKGVVGTKVKYARVHEFGEVITPKKKQALTIPFPGNVGAYPSAQSLRNTKKTYISKGIIYYVAQKGAKPVPIYILKKSVKIPARPFVQYVRATYWGKFRDLFNDHITSSIGTPSNWRG
jgi:phage gpG-like protein